MTELNDYTITGTKVKIDYFNGTKDDTMEVEMESIIEHVSEEGLNLGWMWGATEEDGSREQVDVSQDAESWTKENIHEAVKSYTEKQLK